MPDELEAFFNLPLPPVRQGVSASNGYLVSYVQTGNPEGGAVLLLHGSPGSWEDWKLVIDRPRLKKRFNLVAVDRPGWGRTAGDSLTVAALSKQSELLWPLLEEIAKTGKVIVVGHSLGGPIALRVAVDYPRSVAAVVLLAPSLDPDLDAVRWFNRLADLALVRFFLPEMLQKANEEIMALPQELGRLALKMVDIRVPVVMVHGLNDELVDPGNTAYARPKMKNAIYRETLLPNFGHLIPHLRPGEVVLAIETATALVAPE